MKTNPRYIEALVIARLSTADHGRGMTFDGIYHGTSPDNFPPGLFRRALEVLVRLSVVRIEMRPPLCSHCGQPRVDFAREVYYLNPGTCWMGPFHESAADEEVRS